MVDHTKPLVEYIPEGGNPEVAALIRSCVLPLSKAGADLRRAFREGQTAKLIDYLRSGEELSAGDRDLLADILSGDLGRTTGKPRTKAPEKIKKRKVYERYKELMASPTRPRAEAVAQVVADEFDLLLAEVLSLVKYGPP